MLERAEPNSPRLARLNLGPQVPLAGKFKLQNRFYGLDGILKFKRTKAAKGGKEERVPNSECGVWSFIEGNEGYIASHTHGTLREIQAI
jgi:hypothetical protein